MLLPKHAGIEDNALTTIQRTAGAWGMVWCLKQKNRNQKLKSWRDAWVFSIYLPSDSHLWTKKCKKKLWSVGCNYIAWGDGVKLETLLSRSGVGHTQGLSLRMLTESDASKDITTLANVSSSIYTRFVLMLVLTTLNQSERLANRLTGLPTLYFQ